jgi:hypothetical protein
MSRPFVIAMILPDPWDSAIWITPKDKEADVPYIPEISAHLSQIALRPREILGQLEHFK